MSSTSADAITNQSVRSLVETLELPYYAKYLLVAAFLASYNSAKEDKRLFVKHHGKQRKRMQAVNKAAKVIFSWKYQIYWNYKNLCSTTYKLTAMLIPLSYVFLYRL